MADSQNIYTNGSGLYLGTRGVYELRQIFGEINIENVFGGEVRYSLITLLERARTGMMNTYIAKWTSDLESQPKLRTFITYKEQYCAEQYTMTYLPPHLRSCLAQFRAGILPIEIELGRFHNKRPEERLCPVCPLQEIEDECHFVFKCQHYTALRTILFDNIDIDLSNTGHALRVLMNVHTKTCAMFIYTALQKRKDTIYKT